MLYISENKSGRALTIHRFHSRWHRHISNNYGCAWDLLSVLGSDIWITVPPVPVGPLLPVAQLNESTLLVVLGLVPLVRAVFIAVPGVIVLVVLVVVPFVVLPLSVFLVPVVSVLRAGSSHHRNRRSKGRSQKK